MLKTDRNSILLALLILIQPILDICSYFAIQAEATAITSALRLAIFGVTMLYAFFLSNRKKVYYIFAGAVGVYWIIHMILCARDGYSLVLDCNGFLRTIQMPALTLAFITLFQRAEKFPANMGKCFLGNYIIIGVSIAISLLINKPVYTYWPDIGIKGWFSSGNSQGCILSILSMLTLYDAYRKKNNVQFILSMVLIFALMFLLGTLVTYYSIFITAISFLVLILWNREKKFVIAGALVLAVVLTVAGYDQSPMNKISTIEGESLIEWEDRIEQGTTQPTEKPGDPTEPSAPDQPVYPSYNLENTPLEPLVDRFGYDRVLEIYGGDIDAMEIMDNRLRKVNFGRLVMGEKDIWTLLFGCEEMDLYHDGSTFDPENDFPALFFYYGIVGFGMYIAFLGYFAWMLLKAIFKNLKKLDAEKVLLGLSLVLALGTAQLSANVLRRPSVSIFISLMLAYVYYVCVIQKEQKDETECHHSGL